MEWNKYYDDAIAKIYLFFTLTYNGTIVFLAGDIYIYICLCMYISYFNNLIIDLQ